MQTRATLARVQAARALAQRLLAESPDRWRHTVGVVRRAEELAVTVRPGERDILIVAAWLHDIGYSSQARVIGFHPFDGAVYLAERGWPPRITSLVAHHSGADFLASVSGHYAALGRFPEEQSAVSDALTYADQTTGPGGEPVSIEARLAESLGRHGVTSAHALVNHVRGPHLRAVASRVERRLRPAVFPPPARVSARFAVNRRYPGRVEDPFNLDRFVSAQDAGGTYENALGELRRGWKVSHWMWFVFPQIAGLGHSGMAQRYAIGSLGEAQAYLRHPVLGPRLRACAEVVAATRHRSADDIFGDLDAQKLRSSMTLFLRADPAEAVFQRVLDSFFGGEPDPETDRRL